ncbi:RHS repeat domain-containing protein, partial [Fulvivirga kasyanovii]
RVFFDDMKVVVTESNVLETSDYYPFGLQVAGGFRRVTAKENRFKFQGQEHISDLGLNWDSFKWRNHQPDIGRFFNVDPLADDYVYNSPYAFAENRVIDGRELEGLEWVNAKGQKVYDPKANGGKGSYTQYATDNHKRLGNSLQGTNSGKRQFSKLVNSEAPITTILNESKGPTYKDKESEKKGILQLGVTDVTTYKEINFKTGKSEIGVDNSEIKINLGSILKIMEDGGTFSGEDLKGLSLEEVIGAVFGHEIEHTTQENVNVKEPEEPAHDISAEIIRETKDQNDEKK